jgi:hypothetical protein
MERFISQKFRSKISPVTKMKKKNQIKRQETNINIENKRKKKIKEKRIKKN